MKILLLCWRDSTHPQGGGSERYLERVATHLAAEGHEVIYHTARPTEQPRRSQRDGVRIQRAGGKYTVYPLAWALMLLGRLGIGPLRGVDVVVDTQNGIPFFAGLISGRPTALLTHHCHREQWPVAGRLLSRLGWVLESRVAPWVYRHSRYVTVSGPSRDELIALGVAGERISIIRNGADPIPTDLPALAEDSRLHLVTLSRLVPHKQIEHALDCVAALANEGYDVVLDVIGSGWWEDRLRAHAEAGRVVFHGHVSDAYKHALLARSAIHLMPSRKEGWGLAVVEAAQHGVPTIGYRSSGGLRDSIAEGRTGLLVDSPVELIDATRRLLDDPARRRRLGEAARDWARGFSWEDTGERFSTLLGVVSRDFSYHLMPGYRSWSDSH